MSAGAWAAALAALWQAVYPIALGAVGGWLLRGETEACRRRKGDRA